MELPRSADGYSSLLVWTERVSKIVVIVHMSNQAESITALEVAKAFVDNVFAGLGPQHIFAGTNMSSSFNSP